MGRKRGSYLCKQCTSEKMPVPLKWHICPYKKKYRCVKRDANSKVIEKREVEIQTEEPSFLQQMNESRSKEPKCNKVEK
ncbi:hypothetical protein FRACYDRAFT_273715 [Fragilariopsis cylindrus CCMP1102]|uniref:Uncharacterized protein n=1 Tax=Fragilariopsis cylindrus CCMP1102 TaxID=635003 RepID=A0A1E7FUX9_9STRA|nr:hypothetical protein FRACYDRAFT_273715 [Fragilariopsis cylindrus CCMP1102]|eukprot:OEU21944.1 hypothetical protein FRACYDRAFT_273715 [Fragilariopsis cylindrus CCMP1102]